MTHRTFRSLVIAAGLALASAGGCSHNETDPSRNGPLNSTKSTRAGGPVEPFEATKGDPAITAETTFAAAGYAEDSGQLPKAADLYRQTLKADPKHLQAMYRLGILTAKMQQFGESIDVWKRYAKATNESAEAYSNLAYTQELAGQPNDAEVSYQKGIAHDPKNVPCRVNYGILLAKQGKANEATVQLQSVLSPAEVHYNLASVYEQQGKKDQARQEYKRALELDPELNDAKQRLSAIDVEAR